MKILMVSLNKLRSYRPALPVGMVVVATQLQAHGHDVACIDLMFEDDDEAAIRRAVSEHAPDVIGLSLRNLDSQSFLEPAIYVPLAMEVTAWAREQRPEALILLGGAGFSAIPREVMEMVGADYGIAGFAEDSAVELMRRLEGGESPRGIDGVVFPLADGSFYFKPPNFEYRPDRVAPFDASFYDPRYADYTFETHHEVRGVAESVQTKKGCVLECIFCSNFLIDGTGVKLRDPKAVVDDIEGIRDRGGDTFEVVDGVFNLPLHHALAVLEELEARRLDLSWCCMVNPGAVTPELVERMARTGCREIEFGTDSGDDAILRRLGKNFRRERIRQVHGWFADAGIRITHCLFIASPDDTRESIFQTFDLMDDLVPAGHPTHRAFWTLGQRIAPGTGLHQIALDRGLLGAADPMLVPRYFLEPRVIADDRLLDDIEARVVANPNWYLWWGLGQISLRERVRQAFEQNRAIEAQFETLRAARRRVARAV